MTKTQQVRELLVRYGLGDEVPAIAEVFTIVESLEAERDDLYTQNKLSYELAEQNDTLQQACEINCFDIICGDCQEQWNKDRQTIHLHAEVERLRGAQCGDALYHGLASRLIKRILEVDDVRCDPDLDVDLRLYAIIIDRKALQADNARLRKALEEIASHDNSDCCWTLCLTKYVELAQSALQRVKGEGGGKE